MPVSSTRLMAAEMAAGAAARTGKGRVCVAEVLLHSTQGQGQASRLGGGGAESDSSALLLPTVLLLSLKERLPPERERE